MKHEASQCDNCGATEMIARAASRPEDWAVLYVPSGWTTSTRLDACSPACLRAMLAKFPEHCEQIAAVR